MSGTSAGDLDEWRSRIDRLNLDLLATLSERARCALAIAELKRERGLPIHDPERENRVLRNVYGQNRGPFDDEALGRIFACIMAEHRRLEEEGSRREAEGPH